MSGASTRLRWTSEAGPAALFGGKDAPLFGRRQRRPRGPRVPVVAVTGFLGSGKTTLIRALLDKPEGANTAVVVNEYGEVGIDNALLAVEQRRDGAARQRLPVLQRPHRSAGNACAGLFADRARGAVPSFERVVIETSGLADPGSGVADLCHRPGARP